MHTYQYRPRIFRVDSGTITLPAKAEVRFYLQPLQPFGMEAGGGRTIVRAVAANMLYNANTGGCTFASKEPLRPLNVQDETGWLKFTLKGNVLTVSHEEIKDLKQLNELIHGIYFGLPPVLNTRFIDPPFVERVDGRVGSTEFRWEVERFAVHTYPTTQDEQEAAFLASWSNQLSLITNPSHRRLLGALHYFHTACRLDRRGSIAGEFLAEVILNLSKTLEVLFPPAGDGKTRDAVRSGLAKFGFSDQAIERDYLPAMALRNEIDVGHVELALFKSEDIKVIHDYTARAEPAFRCLLRKVLEAYSDSGLDVPEYDIANKPKPAILAIIERLRSSQTPTLGSDVGDGSMGISNEH